MFSNISIINQLLERLQTLKTAARGDVHGVVDTATGSVTLLAVVVAECALPHDPALLLPPTLEAVGCFTTQDKQDQNNSHDAKLMVVVSKDELTIRQREDSSSDWQDVEYSIISQDELEANYIVCRTRLTLDLTSRDKTADVKNVVAMHCAKVIAGAACFMLQDSDLVLGSREGVLCYGACFTDDQQCIGEKMEGQQRAKLGYKAVDSLIFEMLFDHSSNGSTDAPIVKVFNEKVKLQNTLLKGECIAYVLRSKPIAEVGKILLQSVLQHLKLSEHWLIKLLNNKTMKGDLESVNVLPYTSGHLFSLLYPSSSSDQELQEYRKSVNQSFVLPLSCPFMGRDNAYEFSDIKLRYHLYNTHVGLRPPSVAGLSSITNGIYSYHHYMQDKFNDNKWGCAYRSLQTIVSWFIHQGYTTKAVPTHTEIQQCLVTIGDKPGKFVGSTEWIGSTEVGFVLETYLGVTSRFISVTSADELPDKGRELVHHFNTQGTPIMIGGGVLAHTILGVAWNPDSGDINYLILDPHYTGGEDLNVIQKQGWCGWKGQKFWNAKAYYNLCLPQRPITV